MEVPEHPPHGTLVATDPASSFHKFLITLSWKALVLPVMAVKWLEVSVSCAELPGRRQKSEEILRDGTGSRSRGMSRAQRSFSCAERKIDEFESTGGALLQGMQN